MDAEISDEDRKLFIQAFAEPTEAYRFIEEHRKENPPLFLNRNLTYANYRKCRQKKPKRRSSGKFNTLHSIADKLAVQKRGTKHYMTLTFSGFHCDELMNYRHAEVQVFHKQTKIKLTSVIIDINPSNILKGLSTVSLPTEVLKIISPDGNLLDTSSCILLIKVRIIERMPTQHTYLNNDESIDNFIFETELELFDKSGNGLIASGQRDLIFSYENLSSNLMSLPKQAMWKIKHFVKKSLSMTAIDDDEEFLKPAKIKCDLQWSREIYRNSENKENGSMNSTNGTANNRVFTRSRSTGSIMSRRSITTHRSSDNIQCLVYQFIHKNYRQKTELWDRNKCPWCSLKTANLYILLKHLTLCHGRFKFKYVPASSEIRIDVFVNKRDNKAKVDPFSRMGTTFRGKEPHKRNVMTAIIVNRPERSRPKMSEFFNIDTNPKRTFYHSYSGIPLRPSEIDIDSEDEVDPSWLRQNTVKMIDEFVDVNDGEKDIMKLWNLFVLKHSFICDAQLPAAVVLFVETHGEYIIENHLYRNCIIHLSNLFDYGLISDKHQYNAIKALQRILVRNLALVKIFKERIDEQHQYQRSLLRIVDIGKTPAKQKRTVQRMYAACKRRLRSQSRCEPIANNKKTKHTEAFTTRTPPILGPRPVRKLARITK